MCIIYALKGAIKVKYSIVYSSRTGNTKFLAEYIRNILPEDDCVYFGEPNEKALDADMIYAGFWTDKGTCDEKFKEFLCEINGQSLFLFGTAGFGGSKEYFDKILSAVKENIGDNCKLSGEFMCQGKMPMAVRQRYEAMADSPQKRMMIENFDEALSHPDDDDFEHLKAAVLENK